MKSAFGQTFGRPTKFVPAAEVVAPGEQVVTLPRRDYEKIRNALIAALAMLEMSDQQQS